MDGTRENLVFSEKHVMAVSLKNVWTRMASTYQCIHVDLTGSLLIVKPIWLIGWMTILLWLDLYHRIPVSRIRSVKENGKWASYGKVDITFLNAKGELRGLRLYLKRNSEFIDKLRPMIQES